MGNFPAIHIAVLGPKHSLQRLDSEWTQLRIIVQYLCSDYARVFISENAYVQHAPRLISI